MEHPNRRAEDHWLFKIVKLWPLILSLIVFFVAAGRIQSSVESNSVRLKDHDERINRLEDSLKKVTENTDLLVEKLVRRK